METTITVNLDEAVVQIMNDYAMQNNTTISEIIKDYALSLKKTDPEEDEPFDREYWEKYLEENITPAVKKLSGVFKRNRDIDTREAIVEYLTKKHL